MDNIRVYSKTAIFAMRISIVIIYLFVVRQSVYIVYIRDWKKIRKQAIKTDSFLFCLFIDVLSWPRTKTLTASPFDFLLEL